MRIHVLLAFYRCTCTAYFLTSVCLDNLNCFKYSHMLLLFSTGHICTCVNISVCGVFDDSATLLNYVDYDRLCIVCMCTRIHPQLSLWKKNLIKSEVEDWMTIRRITDLRTRFPLIRCIVPCLRHLLQKSCPSTLTLLGYINVFGH